MKMKIVAVFHGAKVEGMAGRPTKIGANPPMTVDGMQKILALVPTIAAEGPYTSAYCSRLSRAMDAASILALELDMDFETMKDLGQHGNKDGSDVIMYPGNEGENMSDWQRQGGRAISKLFDLQAKTVLIVSHRPIIAGLVAAARGVYDIDGLNAIVNDPALTKKGYVVFECDDGKLTVVE